MASPDDDFARYCCELLARVGPCKARRMFGGWGISTEGLTFAIIAWDTLYLKTDAASEPRFLAAGGKPFVYEARGKAMKMNYHTAPEDAMESPQLMAPWALQALDCALKAAAARAPRARPATKSRAKPPMPETSRPLAPKARPKAARKSAKG